MAAHKFWRIYITKTLEAGNQARIYEMVMRNSVVGENLAIGGGASSSSFLPGNHSYAAFDGDQNSFWLSNGAGGPHWLSYEFINPVEIHYVVVFASYYYNDVGGTTYPLDDYCFQHSDNGIDWTTLKCYTKQGGFYVSSSRTHVLTSAFGAPTFTGPIPDQTANILAPYVLDASLYFFDGTPDSYTLQNAPAWMTINSSGIIRGTPDAIETVSGITVTATQTGQGSAVSNAFNIVVGDVSNLLEMTPIDYDLSPYFSNNPSSYSLQNAPAWLTIDNKGRLYGFANVRAISVVSVIAANADGDVSDEFEINSESPIGRIPDFTIEIGETSHKDMSVYFTTIVSSYTLQNAPSWMTIDDAGLLTMEPTVEDVVSGITITMVGSLGTFTSKPFEVEVISAIEFTRSILQTFPENKLTSYFYVSGYVKGIATSYSLTAAPSWMTINDAGRITMSPTVEGDTTGITVTAASALSSDTASIQVTVTPALKFSLVPDFTALEGEDTIVEMSNYLNTNADMYELTSAPSWITIDNTGRMTISPSSAGTASVTVKATQTYIASPGSSPPPSRYFTTNAFSVKALSNALFISLIPSQFIDSISFFDVAPFVNVTADSYSLNNAPTWVSIDNNGMIHMYPPSESAVALGVSVTVNSGTRSDTSNEFSITYEKTGVAVPAKYWRILVTDTIAFSGSTMISDIEMRTSVGGSNQCVGGIASASDYYNSEYDFSPSQAFDGLASSMWYTPSSSQWIRYEFSSTRTIVEFTIRAAGITVPPGYNSNAELYAPKSMQLQYSTDGITWTTTKSYSDLAPWSSHEKRTFSV